MTAAEHGWLAAAAVAVVLGVPAVADAQSAEAEALFRDGRRLIKAGKLAAGCDKVAASERLETSVGTLLNLGDCREKLGKLASAWAAFRKAEGLARRTGGDERRQAEAARRAAALEPRLSTLTIQVERPVDGLVVRRDGEVIEPAGWNTALPIDAGSYTFSAEAPGRVAWRQEIAIAGGAVRRVVVVPALAPAAPVAESAPESGAASWPPPRMPRAEPVTPAVAAGSPGTWTATRVVSAGLAIAGAGALGAGIYFGVHARDLEDRADARCPDRVCSDLEGLRLNDRAHTSASYANVLYIAGGATLATAVVLWFVGAPHEVVVAPVASDRQAGITLTGSF